MRGDTKKRPNHNLARIARFYGGLWGKDLSAFDLATLDNAMGAIIAEEQLRSGKVRDKDVYDVALLAFGSADIASNLYAKRIAARYRAGERPDL